MLYELFHNYESYIHVINFLLVNGYTIYSTLYLISFNDCQAKKLLFGEHLR